MGQSSTTELKSKLQKTIRSVLNVDSSNDVTNLTAKNYPAWDSLRHVELCLKIQNEFGVRFDGNEIVQMRSYADIERILFAHLKV